MRRLPFLTTLIGVVLLASGLITTADAIAQGHAQQTTLRRDAAQISASFTSYFERARSLDLLLAHNPTFIQPAAGTVDYASANRALRYLQVLYPGVIGEACVIDERGHEVARVTEGVPATVADLATNEAHNRFFGPTLALRSGAVYQAAPYVSLDTGEWVISNSTWVRLPTKQRLIVHFEVTLASFGRYVTAAAADRHAAVMDGDTGQVVLQDNAALPATKAGRFPVADWSAAYATATTKPGFADIHGHWAAVQRIDRMQSNANHWLVVEWSTADASVVPPWLGILITVFGLLLIVLALVLLLRQHSTLSAAARLDHLTCLGNRKALEEALTVAFDAANRPGGDRIAVITIDLDGFKQINDTLGHDKGDLVLKEIARRLYANVFEYDTAARLGGDEFAVVLRSLHDTDDVAAVAHRLRDALIRPIDIDGVPRFIGASVGAAAHPDHGQTSAELLRNADAAMYQAKRGHEGVRIYDPGTAAGADELGLAAELLIAITDQTIELAFQPQFSLTTGEVVGAEALARWDRPGYGPVPPAEFVPLAEQTGLIHTLTMLTLRRALDEVSIWQESGVAIPVSVNLSGQLVGHRTLSSEIAALLEERGLHGSALVLEITETAAIDNRHDAPLMLHQLRTLGIRVELDDFGSGFASFAALQDLPLDGVKLDRNLIADQTQGDSHLLSATIALAHRLGLNIVAEGIEDAATLQLVRRAGCDTAQGYHLGRPTTPDSIRALLARPVPARKGGQRRSPARIHHPRPPTRIATE